MTKKAIAVHLISVLILLTFAGCSRVEQITTDDNETTTTAIVTTVADAVTGENPTVTDNAFAETEIIDDFENSYGDISDDGPEDISAFNDTLFIGDSRTEGIRLYGGVDTADFFSSVGLNIFRLFSETIDVENYGSTDLNGLLSAKSYGKIFVSLGINEMGYNLDVVQSKFGEALEEIHSLQPDAVIYIQANLHITAERSESDTVSGGPFQNTILNDLNSRMASFENGDYIVYLDPNPLFDDAEGALGTDYAADDFHLQAFAYKRWMSWLDNVT